MPLAQRWDYPRYDSFLIADPQNPNGFPYFERLGLEGSYVDFRGARDGGPLPQVIKRGVPNPAGNREVISIIAYPDGSPRLYFEGVYLIDGQTLQWVANGQPLVSDYPLPQGAAISPATSYFQHIMVPDPVDPDIAHIFYGMSFSSANWNPDRNMPAWYARYDMLRDTLLVVDSVLHGRASEGWCAQRHPDGQGWWLANRMHSPSGIMIYQLSPSGLQPGIFSPGGVESFGSGASDISGIAFSPDGTNIAYTVVDSSGFLPPSYGEVYVTNFDCASGRASNFVRLDSMCEPEGMSFSPDGSYLYVTNAHNTSGRVSSEIDSLYRWKVPQSGEAWGQPEIYTRGFAKLGISRSPDGRIITGNIQNGIVTYPDRWFDTLATALLPNRGAHFDTLAVNNWVGSLNIPSIPITLPDLRTPHLRGQNMVSCGDTLSYSIIENCYQDLGLVSTAAGPGVHLTRAGADVQLTFDTASTLPPVRYVALANNHPCRTYRDTFWVYVEGCEQTCAPVTTAAQLTACDSASIHGIWQSSSGNYSQTYQSFSGCDSTSTISLSISPSVATAETITACDSTLVHGIWQSSSGDYSQTFQSFTGCDSTSTISLSISPSVATAETITACDSVQVHGIWQSNSGNYRQTYQSFSGCDSTSTISLSITPSVATAETITACDSTLAHGIWQSSSGDYSQTYQSFSGCDSTSTISLSISSVLETAEEVIACDSTRLNGQWVYESGEHEQAFSSVQGCDSIHTTTVTILDSPARPQLPQDTLLAPEEALQLSLAADPNLAYSWQPDAAVDCADCAQVEVVPSFEGRLSVEVSDDQGCSTLAAMLVLRAPEPNLELWAPTAFSPNGDGVNDNFSIALPAAASLLSCTVYDRWGNSLSSAEGVLNAPPGQLLPVWDGTVRGKTANPGVFVWQAEWRDVEGVQQLATGEVTLLK